MGKLREQGSSPLRRIWSSHSRSNRDGDVAQTTRLHAIALPSNRAVMAARMCQFDVVRVGQGRQPEIHTPGLALDDLAGAVDRLECCMRTVPCLVGVSRRKLRGSPIMLPPSDHGLLQQSPDTTPRPSILPASSPSLPVPWVLRLETPRRRHWGRQDSGTNGLFGLGERVPGSGSGSGSGSGLTFTAISLDSSGVTISSAASSGPSGSGSEAATASSSSAS